MTYQDFQAQTDTDAQLLHAGRFCAPLPEEGVEIVFEAGGADEDGLLPLLLPQDRPLRLDGTAGRPGGRGGGRDDSGPAGPGPLPTEDSPVPCQLLEGAGTAYYVADQYARFQLDRDGDGAGDAALEVALNSRQAVDPPVPAGSFGRRPGLLAPRPSPVFCKQPGRLSFLRIWGAFPGRKGTAGQFLPCIFGKRTIYW